MFKKRTFLILSLSAFGVMMGMGIIAPLMPLYAKNMGASGIWLGIIFSSYSLSRLLFVPLIGKISDRKGRKIVISIGLFLYSLFSLGYVFADTVYWLTVVRFLQGFASAMTLPIIMAFIGDISPEGEEGRYMGNFNVSRFLGMGLGPMLGGVMNDAWGINSAFYALSGITGLVFFLAVFFLPESETFTKKENKKKKSKNVSFKQILKLKVMRGLLFFRLVSSLGRGSLMSFLSVYAFSFGISPGKVGTILTLNILTLSFLQMPFGRLADKIPKSRLIYGGGFLSVISLFLIPQTGSFILLLLFNIFWGSGRAMGIPATSAINTMVGRKYGMGSSTGLYMTASNAGMVLAPLISGVLMQFVGIKWVFYFSGLAIAAGLLIFYTQVKGMDLNNPTASDKKNPLTQIKV